MPVTSDESCNISHVNKPAGPMYSMLEILPAVGHTVQNLSKEGAGYKRIIY